MDSRIYEMLEQYKLKNATASNRPHETECLNTDYCIETEFGAKDGNILTMAFVNMQPIETVYDTEKGFCQGTIFPNIDKPFYGGRKYE